MTSKFLNINEVLKDKELTLRKTVFLFLAGKVTQTLFVKVYVKVNVVLELISKLYYSKKVAVTIRIIVIINNLNNN